MMSEIVTVNSHFLERGPRLSRRPGTLPHSHIAVMSAPFSQPERGTDRGEGDSCFSESRKRTLENPGKELCKL